MQENVVVLTFVEEAKAYQALSELKQAAAAGRLVLKNAAVIDRSDGLALRVRDGYSDNAAANPPLYGTLIGSLIGVLGGPLGVLLGGATGALFGSAMSADVIEARASLMDQMLL